jgi:hypothetical protein
MSAPFLIRHPETRVQYELESVDYFVSQYKPQGFDIVDPAPTGYTVPELPKAEPKVRHGASVKRTNDANTDAGDGKS